MGNNPCLPYDTCIHAFAGSDADIVHWEQSYNCWDALSSEQFIRQSMTLPHQPVVIFSNSDTPNWLVWYTPLHVQHRCIISTHIPCIGTTARTWSLCLLSVTRTRSLLTWLKPTPSNSWASRTWSFTKLARKHIPPLQVCRHTAVEAFTLRGLSL